MAMQRARRFASAAVVASLAVAGLSACRTGSSVAAYVGDSELTETRVQQVYDQVRAATGGAPITRTDVVHTILSDQVLTEVAKRHSVALPADLSTADYATSLHLPPDSDYVRMFAESDTYVKLLRQGIKDLPEPTDAELKEIFDILVANGQVADGGTFAQFKTSLPAENKQLVQTATAVRKEITEVADSLDIHVNPKYQPIGIAVLQFQTSNGEVRPLVTAPLGPDETSPVTDAR
jgi:hypothetical protein